jgi:predicted small secreted protein
MNICMDKGENPVKRTRKIIFIGILCAFCLAGCGRTEKQAGDSGELVLVSAQHCFERWS